MSESVLSYPEGLRGGPQLRHCVVVVGQVRQLTLRVERRKTGQLVLQLADAPLMGLHAKK